MARSAVSHYCHKCLPDGTTGRCCRSDEEAMTKFMKGLEVFHGLLLCGSPDPTEVRWFSAAFKARCVVLGLMLSRLLPRSWQQTFHRQLGEARAAAAADDRSLVCDLHTDTRRRHRQVRCLLCTRSLCFTAALSSSCLLPMRFCFEFPKFPGTILQLESHNRKPFGSPLAQP